jgi:RHS repeat-associated protein
MAEIGRFVSADPFVQTPYDPQNLNRYSYVVNSPQNYVDPDGYFHR